MQDNDRIRSTDTPGLCCGEPLLVEEDGIPAAEQPEPGAGPPQGLRWCWNGCQYTADKIN